MFQTPVFNVHYFFQQLIPFIAVLATLFSRSLSGRNKFFQVLLQLFVVNNAYGIYVAALETGIIRTEVIKCDRAKLRSLFTVLITITEPVVSCAHSMDSVVQLFADASTKKVLKAHLEFWKVVDSYVEKCTHFLL